MSPRVSSDQRRRADAERNLAAIIDAGRVCLSRNPAASMTEIAQAAGVGRVTLYGHFSSREELVEAVVKDVMRAAEGAFEAARTDTGPAVDALSRLVRASWHALDGSAGLHAAAVLAFGEEWVRANHGDMLERVAELVDRGRAEGDIRTDLPASWLVSVVYGVIHTAADEVAAGRLAASAAGKTIDATVRGALAMPPSG